MIALEVPRATRLRLAERPWRVHAGALVAFVLAAALADLSHQYDRPLTGALIYLLGVTVVGALEGVWGGLIAAVAASLIYNFFLSDPVFRFSLTSADEYVPLIAFNLSAAASGLLTGRLHDRARAAEVATRRTEALLDISRKLQTAVRLEEVQGAVAFQDDGGAVEPELYVLRNGLLESLQEASPNADRAMAFLVTGRELAVEGGETFAVLRTTAEPIGVVVFSASDPQRGKLGAVGTEAYLNLLSIALERCLLLEQLSEAELVKRSEEFKTALLSSVSHDMRTPLSAISASASSLASFGDDLPRETRADLLTMIQEQCDRLNRYTTNLLNLGRLQSGLGHAVEAECDALDVLGIAIRRARSLGTKHRIEKHYDVSSCNVRADPVMLEQVFYNVLENALRYSPEESEITVSASAGPGHLTILIEDQGLGIPKQDLARVFDRFYRAPPTLAQDGSGLGLSIAKGFVEAFGGSIMVNRSSMDGTIIEIVLPITGEGPKA